MCRIIQIIFKIIDFYGDRLDWRLYGNWLILLVVCSLIIQIYSLVRLCSWWWHSNCIWSFNQNCIFCSLFWSILRWLQFTFNSTSVSSFHSKTFLCWISMRKLRLVPKPIIYSQVFVKNCLTNFSWILFILLELWPIVIVVWNRRWLLTLISRIAVSYAFPLFLSYPRLAIWKLWFIWFSLIDPPYIRRVLIPCNISFWRGYLLASLDAWFPLIRCCLRASLLGVTLPRMSSNLLLRLSWRRSVSHHWLNWINFKLNFLNSN